MSGRQDTTQELQEQASEQSVPSEFSRASNRQPPNPTAGTVPPPSIAMSGASLLSKRRLTAPPHLIGIPSEAAYQHPMGGSLPTAGAYTPDTMSSSGSSSGTLPSGSAYTFGAQQQQMPPNWSEQLYQQQPAGHTPNYAYSAPIPPQLYSMRPADGPLGQPLASAPYSSSTNQSDSPEHASYSPEFQQSFFDPFQ